MSKSDDTSFDQWGPIGGDGDRSASAFNYLRECVQRLGWEGEDQFEYLVRNDLPTVDLLEDFFSVVPAWLDFLLARGRIKEVDAASLIEFEQFLVKFVCSKPWEDDKDALNDPLWRRARDRAALLLATLPPHIAEL